MDGGSGARCKLWANENSLAELGARFMCADAMRGVTCSFELCSLHTLLADVDS